MGQLEQAYNAPEALFCFLVDSHSRQQKRSAVFLQRRIGKSRKDVGGGFTCVTVHLASHALVWTVQNHPQGQNHNVHRHESQHPHHQIPTAVDNIEQVGEAFACNRVKVNASDNGEIKTSKNKWRGGVAHQLGWPLSTYLILRSITEFTSLMEEALQPLQRTVGVRFNSVEIRRRSCAGWELSVTAALAACKALD